MLQRLGNTIGLGIATAVFTSVQQKQSSGDDPITPYLRAYDVSVAFAGMAIIIVPFLKLDKQGNVPKEETEDSKGSNTPKANEKEVDVSTTNTEKGIDERTA